MTVYSSAHVKLIATFLLLNLFIGDVTIGVVSAELNSTVVPLYINVTTTNDMISPEVNSTIVPLYINMTATHTLHRTTDSVVLAEANNTVVPMYINATATKIPYQTTNDTEAMSTEVNAIVPLYINVTATQTLPKPNVTTQENNINGSVVTSTINDTININQTREVTYINMTPTPAVFNSSNATTQQPPSFPYETSTFNVSIPVFVNNSEPYIVVVPTPHVAYSHIPSTEALNVTLNSPEETPLVNNSKEYLNISPTQVTYNVTATDIVTKVAAPLTSEYGPAETPMIMNYSVPYYSPTQIVYNETVGIVPQITERDPVMINSSGYYLRATPTPIQYNGTVALAPQITERDPVNINISMPRLYASPTPILYNGTVTYTAASQLSEYYVGPVETPFTNNSMANLSPSPVLYNNSAIETPGIVPEPVVINSTVPYHPHVIPTQTLDNSSNETLYFPLPPSSTASFIIYSENILLPFSTVLMQPVPTLVPTENVTIAPSRVITTKFSSPPYTVFPGSNFSGLEPIFSENVGNFTASPGKPILTTDYYASSIGNELLQPLLTESIVFAFETSLLLPTPFDVTPLISPSPNTIQYNTTITTTKTTMMFGLSSSSSHEPPGLLLPLSMTVAPRFTVTEAVTASFPTSENFETQMIFPLQTSEMFDYMFFTPSSTMIYLNQISSSPPLKTAVPTTISFAITSMIDDNIIPAETSILFNPFPTSQGGLLEVTDSIQLKSTSSVLTAVSTVDSNATVIKPSSPFYYQTISVPFVTATPTRLSPPNITEVTPNSTTVEPHSTTIMVSNSTTVEPHSTTVVSNSTTVEPHSATMVQNSTTVEPHSTTMVPNSTTVEPNITSSETSSTNPGNTTQLFFPMSINSSSYLRPLNTPTSTYSLSVGSVIELLSIAHTLPFQEHNTSLQFSGGATLTESINASTTKFSSLPVISSFLQSTSSLYNIMNTTIRPVPTSVYYGAVSNHSRLAELSRSLVPTEPSNMTSVFQSTTANIPSLNETFASTMPSSTNGTFPTQSGITSSTLEVMSSEINSSVIGSSQIESSNSTEITSSTSSLIGQPQITSLTSSSTSTIPEKTKRITSSSTLMISSKKISFQSPTHTSSQQPVVTSIPSVCTPFDNIITPPLNSIVSIILAILPSDLEQIQKPGSLEQCELVEGLTKVFETGLSNKEREEETVVRVRKRNQGRLEGGMFSDYLEKLASVRDKRQLMTEQQYTAVILDISDANSIGENLADVKFYILTITDPTATLAVNSTTVTEIYALANVNDINGYTIVRPAQQPIEDEVTMTSSSDEPIVSVTILGVAAAVVAVILVGIITVLILLTILLCRRRKKGAFRIQVERLTTPQPPDTSRNLDIDVVTRNVNDIRVHRSGSHDSGESSHDFSELSDSSHAPSATSLTALAHSGTLPEQTFVTSDSFQYQAMNGGKENGSGHHHPVTLAHLAHTLPHEQTMSDKEKPVTASTFEMTAHYHPLPASPRPPPRLPPLQPRFHPIPPSSSSPAPPSPTLTSTFRRLPSPTAVKPDTSETVRAGTPHRRMKQRKRRRRRTQSQHSAVSSVRRGLDEDENELMEGLPREQMVGEQHVHLVNNDEELWHRKRATMEYHKYLTGKDSSFHPSHLSYTRQTPQLITTSTPVQQQPLLLSTTQSPVVVVRPGDGGLEQPYYEAYTESETVIEVTEVSDSESSIVTLASEEHKQSLLLEGDEKDFTQRFSAQHQTSESDSMVQKKLTKSQRKEKRLYPSRGRFNINKARRGSKVAPSMVTPLDGAGLAWMDTVNGPQLMSLQPVPISRPHPPPLQLLPPLLPQYLLPQPPQLELSQIHHTSHRSPHSHLHKSPHSHSHKSPHSHTHTRSRLELIPHTDPVSNQPRSARTKKRQQRRDVETETDATDGEEDEVSERGELREQQRTNDQNDAIKQTDNVIVDDGQIQTHEQIEEEGEEQNETIVVVDATAPQDEDSNTIIQDPSNSHHSKSEDTREESTTLIFVESQNREETITLTEGDISNESGTATRAQQQSFPETISVVGTIEQQSIPDTLRNEPEEEEEEVVTVQEALNPTEQQLIPETRNRPKEDLEEEVITITVQEALNPSEQQCDNEVSNEGTRLSPVEREVDCETGSSTGEASAGPTMQELIQKAFSTVPSEKPVHIKPQQKRRSINSAKKDDNKKEQDSTLPAAKTYQTRHHTAVNMPVQVQPMFPAAQGPQPIMWQQQVPQYTPVMATTHHQPVQQYYTSHPQPLSYYPQYSHTQVHLGTSRYNPAPVWTTTPYLMPPYTSTPRYRPH